MKTLLIGAAMIGTVAGQLAAQANLPGGLVAAPFEITMLVPRTSNANWWGQSPCGRGPGRHGDGLFPYWGYACDPLYADNSGDDYPASIITVAIPQVVATPQPEPQPAPRRPPETPFRPEVHEYHWPSSGSDSSTTTFSIVYKDGRVESAIAVWVQDDTLAYITPEGGNGRMPIDVIDRQTTRRRNAEKQLSFWLPPGDGAENSAAILAGGR